MFKTVLRDLSTTGAMHLSPFLLHIKLTVHVRTQSGRLTSSGIWLKRCTERGLKSFSTSCSITRQKGTITGPRYVFVALITAHITCSTRIEHDTPTTAELGTR